MLTLVTRIDGTFLCNTIIASELTHTPDISIEFLDDLPADILQLKIYADVGKTYVAKKGRENIIRPALNKKM